MVMDTFQIPFSMPHLPSPTSLPLGSLQELDLNTLCSWVVWATLPMLHNYSIYLISSCMHVLSLMELERLFFGQDRELSSPSIHHQSLLQEIQVM